MSMNYKEVAVGFPQGELQRYATGIGLVGDFVDSLQTRGILPERFAIAAQTGTIETPEFYSLEPIRFVIEMGLDKIKRH